MGAYGSPELYPQEQQDYGNSYSQYPQYPYKPKTHHVAFFFAGLVVGIVVASILWQAQRPTVNPVQGQIQQGQTVLSPQSQVLYSSIKNESQEYLKNWVKAAVVKGLLYPETARFSANDVDWNITRNGTQCSVSSIVYANDKSKKFGKSSFLVKIQYDDLNAEISYIQIGNHVSYNVTK